MRPSLTTIGVGLFFLFIGQSIWNMYSVWQSPKCDPFSQEICYKSFFNDNPILDLLVYINDNSRSGELDLVLHLEHFDYKTSLEKDVTIKVPKAVKQNGSIFIHTLLLPQKRIQRFPLKEFKNLVKSEDVSYVKGGLTKYAIPQSNTYNLLNEEGTDRPRDDKPVTHVRSRYAVTACTEQLYIPRSKIPNEIMQFFRVNSNLQILPIITPDFLNMRLKDLVEIAPESNTLTFTYVYNPISLGKMRFYLQMEASLRSLRALGFTEKDLDEVKSIFSDTNLYLLCITLVVGSVHLVLDFLSFKNDVSFWRTQKSMAGLSTRSVLWRAFSQAVVFVFLLDEGTSLLVLIPAGIATLIELWKVTKVFKTNLTFSWKGIKFRTTAESTAEAETRKYDEECMKYLRYVLYPLCLGAALYSLYYQPHKSWYSWTINSLVNGVYAFGFLFMLPQLFINYRLKSVAALPWKVFTYKAFNTFIDDIFAFIITMPTAHRVACLRDDVVFLIYLYQRWLYPVDPSRTEGINDEVVEDNDKKKNK